MPAQLSFAGAAGGVTGSCYHLRFEGTTILVDCGTFQGGRDADALNRRDFRFDPREVDAVVLTHGHLDHAGRVPMLVDRGFAGPIRGTAATLDIAGLIMEDTAKLGLRSGDPPLYDHRAVAETRARFKRLSYRDPLAIGPFTVEAFDAGHILGSAHLRVSWRDGGDERVLIFSGDVGVVGTPIIRDPTTAWGKGRPADYVVTESTYGDRAHPDRAAAKQTFRDVIARALADGGKVLIPAFAIGRTQEILYELDQMGLAIPVIVDGPLSVSATKVYHQHRGLYDEEALARLEAGDHPLEMDSLITARDGKQSRRAREPRQASPDRNASLRPARAAALEGPAVIIAGSGMCNGGRIRGHLARYLPDARTDVLLVGYQASGTLGRELEAGAREVWLDGGTVAVAARVTRLSGYSAHADQTGLASWFEHVPRHPHTTAIVTHGEDGARATYAALLRDRFGARTVVPALDQTLEL